MTREDELRAIEQAIRDGKLSMAVHDPKDQQPPSKDRWNFRHRARIAQSRDQGSTGNAQHREAKYRKMGLI